MGYSRRLKLLSILEKIVFKASAVSLSELVASPSSVNIIFVLGGVLLKRNGLAVLQNFFVSVMLFSKHALNIPLLKLL